MPIVSSEPLFEYQSVKSVSPITSDELNWKYGRKDWELISILPLPDGFEYVFKRQHKVEIEPIQVTVTIPPNIDAQEVYKTIQRKLGRVI